MRRQNKRGYMRRMLGTIATRREEFNLSIFITCSSTEIRTHSLLIPEIGKTRGESDSPRYSQPNKQMLIYPAFEAVRQIDKQTEVKTD